MKATKKELEFANSLIGKKVSWTRIIRGETRNYEGSIQSLKIQAFFTMGLDFNLSDEIIAWEMKATYNEDKTYPDKTTFTFYDLKKLTPQGLNQALRVYKAKLS